MKPINRKLSAVIKEGNEKLLKEFNDINSMISQFYDNITDCSANNKENFKQIFYNFNQLKENFIDFCKGLTENLIEQELIIVYYA